MTGKSKASASNAANQLPSGNSAAGAPVLPCAKNKDPQLKVKVYALVKGKRQYVTAKVTANALSQGSTAQTGVADFSYVLPGTHTVKAAEILAPHDQQFYSPGDEQQVALAKGDKKTLNIEVKPRNLVTPKIETEYKVVVFDRDMKQYEAAAADKLQPEPTYIEVSLKYGAGGPPYAGEATLDAPNCAVYLDTACAQPLGGRKLTNAELTASPATRLYLRGTARGPFTLTLTLDPSSDPKLIIDAPATEAMGVVEMQLEVYQHGTAVNVAATTYPLNTFCTDLEKADLIPDQVALSDDDKVSKGRLLHQQHDKHHGRAQALLKLTAAEWPAGTDDYQIVLQATPHDLRAFDAETEGKRQSLPLKTRVSELKAGEKTLWIEGMTASEKLRGVRLSLGLDRAAGGLSKAPKTNGDWARFTVVKIESVKLEYTEPAAGQPKPWDPSKHRWYINYQAGDLGRTVKIRAKLTKPIAGIKLHFMLSPDKNNLKKKNWGIDLPGTWTWDAITDVKQKDKTNLTDLLHLSQDTDAQGQADQDLVLSRFGGDKFTPGAYITQDPHLAAYVHGHATLEKRKPKLASDPIAVWRKFAYQKIKVDGRKYPSTDKAEGMYGRVRAKMFKIPSVHLTAAAVRGMTLPSLLPEYMFKAGGGSKLRFNVSDRNQNQFFTGGSTDGEHPIKIPIITCDYNWGLERNSATINVPYAPASSFPLAVTTDAHVCDPPLQGGALLVPNATWDAREWDAAANGGAGAFVNVRRGSLADGDVEIDRNRASIKAVKINLPASLAGVTADTEVRINNLAVQGADDHFLGGYNIDGVSQRIVCVFDPKDSGDYQNTVAHEIGHAFYQTLAGAPAPGIPANPTYEATSTGPHCTQSGNLCVMYTSGPIPGSLNRYCDHCHPHLLVQDMTSLS